MTAKELVLLGIDAVLAVALVVRLAFWRPRVTVRLRPGRELPAERHSDVAEPASLNAHRPLSTAREEARRRRQREQRDAKAHRRAAYWGRGNWR